MLKSLDDLDKKNKQLTNLALLPGFNFEDTNISSKRQSKYNDSKYNDSNSNFNLDCFTDKNVICDKTFAKFYKMIDSVERKQTKRRRTRDKKLTRRK